MKTLIVVLGTAIALLIGIVLFLITQSLSAIFGKLGFAAYRDLFQVGGILILVFLILLYVKRKVSA